MDLRYGKQRHLDYLYRRLQQTCKVKSRTSVCYVENLNRVMNKMLGKSSKSKKVKRLGCCFRDYNKFYIYIEKNMGFEIKAQTLVHEWAHLMTPFNVPDHGRKWAENYCKAYRSVYRTK